MLDNKKEKVLILGLSKTGIAAAKYLAKHGASCFITELNEKNENNNEKCLTDLKNAHINVEIGKHSNEFIENATYAVASPGIPPKSEIFEKLKESKVEPYITTNTNETQIYTRFIKLCDKYNKDSCLQGNDCAVEKCKLCSYQQIKGWLNSKDLKYLLVKYRILNGLFSFQDPDYQYLKEHNCHAEVQSLKRLLAHHTPK